MSRVCLFEFEAASAAHPVSYTGPVSAGEATLTGSGRSSRTARLVAGERREAGIGNPQKEGWDRAWIDSVLASGKRTVVKLDQPLPVHIVYSTAWLAEDGTIRFYVDFYQLDDKLYQALFGKPVPWRGG